jgi:hypothetical protein
MKRLTVIIGLLAAFAVAGGVASTASAAAPANTAAPTVSGTPKSGSTLTASNGTWSNSPTSYTYQWRRCATDGTACGDIVGATSKTYTLTAADVHHTIRVVVTATNADGKASATSDATDVIGTANGPTNTVKPSVTGSATVGGELTVSNGSWSATIGSYSYQWQRCSAMGTNCLNVAGATGKSYGVRAVDAGNRMRALVTAHTSNGGQTTVASGTSDVVQSSTTTTTVTTTVAGNHAPHIRFLSLRRVGVRVYARFRVCDDSLGKVGVIERDLKARALPYTRRFSVYRTLTCGTFARHWIPAPRFRTAGRYVVTLRAVDKSGALSRLVSRSLFRR